MKYRIENGTVTMPVEEFNRINDKLEEVEKYEEGLIHVVGDGYSYEYWVTQEQYDNELQKRIDSLKKRNGEIQKMTLRQFKKWRKNQ